MERLKTQHCRNSTRETYHKIWNRFSKFFIRLDDKPDTWENRIILFVGYLIEECKLQSSTIRSYISALKTVLAEDKIKLKQDNFVINSLTRACKVKNDQIITRLPIHKDFLHVILKQIDKWTDKVNQPYWNYLYKAMLLTGYYSLLWVGELAQGPHVILADNVHIGVNKNKVLFMLRSSKTHNKGSHPQMVKIQSSLHDTNSQHCSGKTNVGSFCPFNVLRNFIERRPHAISEYEQFFVFSDRSPVKPVHLRSVLRLLISDIGLEPHLYNVHFIRIGHCVDLLKLGGVSRDYQEIW